MAPPDDPQSSFEVADRLQDIKIGKLDVACRLINTAVRMYFRQEDLIAIHTVIASAHQVLFDIGRRRGITGALKRVGGLKNEEIRKHLQSINYPVNFFKHADRDPDSMIYVGPLLRFTEDFIMDAVLLLIGLTNDVPLEAKTYMAWFVSRYPDEFDDVPEDGELRRIQQLGVANWQLNEIDDFLRFGDLMKSDKDT